MAARRTDDTPAEIVDFDLISYDRYVEAPRRAGRDPVWDSMWAEALAGQAENTKGAA